MNEINEATKDIGLISFIFQLTARVACSVIIAMGTVMAIVAALMFIGICAASIIKMCL